MGYGGRGAPRVYYITVYSPVQQSTIVYYNNSLLVLDLRHLHEE